MKERKKKGRKEGRKERHLHCTMQHGTARHGTAHTTRSHGENDEHSGRKEATWDRNGAQYRERLFVSSTFTGSRSALECAFAPSSPSPLPYRARTPERGALRAPTLTPQPPLCPAIRSSTVDLVLGPQVSGPPTLVGLRSTNDSLDRVDLFASLNVFKVLNSSKRFLKCTGSSSPSI